MITRLRSTEAIAQQIPDEESQLFVQNAGSVGQT